jgi:hypothetical protein
VLFVKNIRKSIYKALRFLGKVFLCSSVCAVSLNASSADQKSNTNILGNSSEQVPSKHDYRILIKEGEDLFRKVWSADLGGGHVNGVDPFELALRDNPFAFGMNMVSTPTVSSCMGCHSSPFGVPGGSSEIVTNVVVTGPDLRDLMPAHIKKQHKTRVNTVINANATTGAYGAGFVEMLARQITEDLQSIRDATKPGAENKLTSKGISFGVIKRNTDGSWDVSEVEGLSKSSVYTSGPKDPPSLKIRAFHQVGSVVSIREFTINAFDFHLGIQAVERFGKDSDPDEDGVKNELSVDKLTAITLYQAVVSVPGRVIPNDTNIEKAIFRGEQLFEKTGCTSCHVPSLPLEKNGWVFTEPNPFNDPGNLQVSEVKQPFTVDLTNQNLPQPRLTVEGSRVNVPIYTDFKLHNLSSGDDDPDNDPLNMHTQFGSEDFFSGTKEFLTARLWGFANQLPYFHNGRYTTLRDAILAHGGEAQETTQRFRNLSDGDQGAVVEFLKSLQVLPPGTKYLIVDEQGKKKQWPPANLISYVDEDSQN